jgi:hypothetical protein
MKRKVNKKNYPEVDNFERKQKKHFSRKAKRPKRKLSIYDEFEDDELDDYSFNYDDYEDDEDF